MKIDAVPIVAGLVGDDHATALDIEAHGPSPVIGLCRKLTKAGHDPKRPLHAYRGNVLALKVRSISEAAKLRVGSHGVGFESDPECGRRSLVRSLSASTSSAPPARTRTGGPLPAPRLRRHSSVERVITTDLPTPRRRLARDVGGLQQRASTKRTGLCR